MLWDGNGKDDRRNHKLRVEFSYPSLESDDISTSSNQTGQKLNESFQVAENIEGIRKRAPKSTEANNKDRDTSLTNPEGMYSELQTLRKKYDSVVEYTVQLTAERDYQAAQLEELQKVVSRETARKRVPDTTRASGGNDRITDRKAAPSGFSLFTLIICALIFFFLGRYMKI